MITAYSLYIYAGFICILYINIFSIKYIFLIHKRRIDLNVMYLTTVIKKLESTSMKILKAKWPAFFDKKNGFLNQKFSF